MLSVIDIFAAILCFILLDRFLAFRIKKYDAEKQRLYRRSFRFRMFCSVIFSLITAYYYKGGDSEMFFYAVKDMGEAVKAGDLSFSELFQMEYAEDGHPLSFYFEQDDSKYPVIGFMRNPGNFSVPKLGLLPYLIFFHSYVAMCFVFSFFALSGCIQLFKLFTHYFPRMQREVALATLFLPSVCYWSSGFLKDSICLGAVGFLLYSVFNLFVLKKKIVSSLFWGTLSVYFLFTIKVYILLALIPGIGFWLFGALSSSIRNIAMRRVAIFLSLIVAGLGALYFVNYLTSDESLAKFSMDNILESSDYSRQIFERHGDEGSSFQLNTSNPALLLLNGLVATFFRPFPWEISSAIVAFSAIESLIFLALFLFIIFKKGVAGVFRRIFESPILILSFSFAVVFAVSVGISTTNFGSLSRYKIPCLPFYLMFILGAYHLNQQLYPQWMYRILNWVSPKTA
jgi:hypothetical protein